MQNTSHELALVGERHLKCEISLMAWSSKRDLLCMAATNGDLMLYRLTSLEKVWYHSPSDKDCRIKSICWRPDGSVIGVSYDTSKVGIEFVFMEKAQVICRLCEETVLLKRPGILLKWHEVENDSDVLLHKFVSLSFKDYLSELPKLQSKDVASVDIKSIIGNSKFHILLVCDDQNTVTAFAYGVFPLFSVPSAFYEPTNGPITVLDMCVSNDFQYLINITLTEDEKPLCNYQLVNLTQVTRHMEKCKLLAEKVCHLKGIMSYLGNVLDLMKESCETVVQEMDSKLTTYLINKSLSGTIGDEFMHFLLWGKPSEVVEDLLTNRMSPKSVMKLGTLVEASYTSIQQLLMVNLHLASDALYYHFVEIKGMSTTTILDDFQLFDVAKVTEVLELCGSFVLKATEMHQVIGQSLKNFKAFFRWLYSCLLKFHEKPMEETPQMSMKEMEFVADFIMESFIHEHEQLKMSGKEKHFNLDKVYQYLRDSALSTPQNPDANDWFHLVDTTPSLANNPFILKRRSNASLRQLYVELQNQIKTLFYCSCTVLSSDDMLQSPYLSIPQSFQPHVVQWFRPGGDNDHLFYTLTSKEKFPCSELLLNEISSKSRQCTRLPINFLNTEETGSFYSIQHVSYFNDEFLTAILRNNSSSILAMISLPPLLKELKEHGITSNDIDISTSYVCDAARYVKVRCVTDTMKAFEIAPSGGRNILSVINDSKRHIKAYELDQVNENEDMDETSELDSSTLSL